MASVAVIVRSPAGPPVRGWLLIRAPPVRVNRPTLTSMSPRPLACISAAFSRLTVGAEITIEVPSITVGWRPSTSGPTRATDSVAVISTFPPWLALVTLLIPGTTCEGQPASPQHDVPRHEAHLVQFNLAQACKALHREIRRQLQGAEPHLPRRGHARQLKPAARGAERRDTARKRTSHHRDIPAHYRQGFPFRDPERATLDGDRGRCVPKNPKAAGSATVNTLSCPKLARISPRPQSADSLPCSHETSHGRPGWR